MEQQRQRPDASDERRHFIEKYGTDLILVINTALERAGLSNEEAANVMRISEAEVEGIRCGNYLPGLEAISALEAEADMPILLVPAPQTEDWVASAIEEAKEYFEEASEDQIDLDLQQARSGGSLQNLQGAVTMACNMLRRDGRSVRNEAAEELEKALSNLINNLE